jgi:hypothetical protein
MSCQIGAVRRTLSASGSAWNAPPNQRTPPDPAAAHNFGLDSTARALQKAELKMASSRRLRTALLGLSAALWASPGLAQTTSTSVDLDLNRSGDERLHPHPAALDGDSWVDLATTDAAHLPEPGALPVRHPCANPGADGLCLTKQADVVTATGTNATVRRPQLRRCEQLIRPPQTPLRHQPTR